MIQKSCIEKEKHFLKNASEIILQKFCCPSTPVHTTPILSRSVSSVRGSWNQIKLTMAVSTTVSISLNLLNIWDLEVLNVLSVSCLYWVRKPVGHFLSLSGVLEETSPALSSSIRLTCTLSSGEEIKYIYMYNKINEILGKQILLKMFPLINLHENLIEC